MKEVDDTPVPESESEWDFDAMFDTRSIRMKQLEQRISIPISGPLHGQKYGVTYISQCKACI